MKEGLRSSTLSKREKDNVYAGASCDDSYQVSADEASCKLGKGRRGRKRKNEERENKSDDANSVNFKENIGLSMINKDLVSANDLVISSTSSEVEVGRRVHEDCSKIANIGVQVGPNASDSYKEKLGFHLISNDMDPANNSVLSSPEREVEEGSGTERLECDKDAVVDVEVAVNTEIHAKPDAHADKDKERENVESPKRVDDRNSSDDKEKIGSPSISNNLDHANALVFYSSEKRVEEGSGTEYVECSREANGDVEVGVNGHCDANIDDAHDEDTCKRGKSQLGIEREKVESPKIGGDVTCDGIEEDRGSPLRSHGLDSVKESVVSTLEREFERSESKNVECSKDADSGEECANADDANAIGDTDKSTLKLGKSRRGRKRKKVESSESGDHETKRKKVKDGKGPVIGRVLRSRTTTMSGGEKVVDGTMNAGIVVEKEMKETDQSDKKRVHTEMDESFRPIGMRRKKIKRTRGRPPKVQGKNGPSEVILKEKGESCQPIDTRRKKIKRPRGRPPKVQGKNGVAEVICKEKGESSQPIGTQREKIKRPRGRPPKVHGKNGASEVICEETLKVTGSKESSDLPKAEGIIKGSEYSKVRKKTGASEVISAEKQKVMGSDKNIEQSNAGEDTVKDSNSAEVGRHSRLTSHSHQARSKSGKKLKMRKLNQEGEVGRKEEKQLVREQIIGMLKQAGWTIQYRPRQNREYNDAVYVDCEGRGYWSVTLAYRKLKEKVEGGGADSKTISVFTSIPEEMLSKLFRVTKVKKKKNKKAKQHGQAGCKVDKGIPGKDSSKNKPTANSRGGSKHKGKPKSFSRVGDKSSNTKMKGDTLRCAKDNSAWSSDKGMTRLNREKRQSRKPCALLARRSEKGLDPDIDGFMSYNGKHSLLSWMIDLGTVPPDGKVHYMNHKMASVMLEGRITRDGIQCGCCDKILSISDFESHAGTKLCQPFYNIYLESGVSLLQCLVDSWSKQEVSDCIGFHFVNVDGEDPNDDTCNICGDGGDLICCDSCPSTFHQNCLNIERFPSGDWQCVYCLCKFCGTASGSTSQRDDCNKMNVSELLTCCLCEGKFHQLCVHGNDAVNVASSCPSFCGRKCQELYEQLQVLLGVKQELEEGFSWTLIQRSDVSQDISLGGAPLKVESNSKLAVAFSIMDECFLPIVDQRSGINMIHNVVYSCGSNFSRLNYSGFFTAILERGDEIISAASIRIHGNQLAEMPFIGTCNIYRRQGMCRRLLNAIESALCFLDVEKLIIPAISELLQTWTSVFGFKPLEESKRQEMKCMSMVVFPGTDLLQKPLLKSQFARGNMAPAADVKFTALRTDHHSMHSLPISSAMGLSVGSESTNSPEVFVQHARGISAEAAAFEPGSNLPGGSLNVASNMASETDNLLESAAKDHCPVCLSLTSDNKLVSGSESSACDAPESDGHPTAEWMDTNAQSGSITVLLDEKSMKCNTENNVDSKSSAVSQIGSDTKHCEGKTVQATEEGKEAVDCEQKAEVENFKHDCNPFGEGVIHHSAETLVHPQGTDLVDGFQVSDKNLKCEVLNATSPMSSDAQHEMQLHHNSHGVMVHATSPSEQQRQDIANDTPFSDDGNPYSSCQRDVLESRYPEVAASVDSKQLPFSGASPDTTTGPNSEAYFASNGICKSLESQSGTDTNDIPGVKESSLVCPLGVTHETLQEDTGNNIHDRKQDTQTEIHSLDGDSPLNRPQLCSKSSEYVSGSQADQSVTVRY